MQGDTANNEWQGYWVANYWVFGGSTFIRRTDRDNSLIKYSTVRINMIQGGESKRVRDFRI